MATTGKTFKYKGFVCYWNKEEEHYEIYTKEEWSYGKGNRYPEWDAGSVEECKEWIDGYWEDNEKYYGENNKKNGVKIVKESIEPAEEISIGSPYPEIKQDLMDIILMMTQSERATIKEYMNLIDNCAHSIDYETQQIFNEIIADEQQHVLLLTRLSEKLVSNRYQSVDVEDNLEYVENIE